MKIKLYNSVLLAIFILSGCTADGGPFHSHDRAYFYRTSGDSHYAEGNYELALSDYNKVIKINPKRHDIYSLRAEIYKEQKKYDLALADYNKAIDFNPVPHYYRGRGSVYYMKKQYDSAIKEYIKAIRLNNKYAAAYNSLAWLLATCSDHRYRDGLKAIEFAKKAVDLAPLSPMFDTLAAAYAEAGDFDMAVNSQEKAIQLLKEKPKLGHLDRYEERLESYKRDIPWTDFNMLH